MYEFSSLNNSTEEIKKESTLLKLVFKKKHFTENYLKWQYIENPSGMAIGFNAYSENGTLAAHYVTQPIIAFLFGRETKGLLSLNTATHINHRGKGLFTELAKRTYAKARELGYEFVIGVANQHSTYGFTSKLGFQQVGQLKAIISIKGMSVAIYPDEKEIPKLDFIRKWNEDLIQWRVSNPETKYTMRKKKEHFEIYANSGKFAVKVLLGTFHQKILSNGNNEEKIQHPFKLIIGTSLATKCGFSVNIPGFLRPSTLNLIFKDLTEKNRKISLNNVFFSTIDFDAY